jgi:hypothetical protein
VPRGWHGEGRESRTGFCLGGKHSWPPPLGGIECAPKLAAIEVSGCDLVLVIVRASSRRQARVGGHGPRDVTRPQDLGRVRYRKVIPGAPPKSTPPGPHALDGRSARYRDRRGSRGQVGESPGSGDDRSPAWSQDCKTIPASNADAESKEPDPVNTTDFPDHREVSMPPFRQARRAGPGPKAGTLSTFALSANVRVPSSRPSAPSSGRQDPAPRGRRTASRGEIRTDGSPAVQEHVMSLSHHHQRHRHRIGPACSGPTPSSPRCWTYSAGSPARRRFRSLRRFRKPSIHHGFS